MMDINKLSSRIIGAAIEVHKTLGPGLFEFQCAPYERWHSANCKRIRRIIRLGWVFLLFGVPAPWNVYPVESVSYSVGAKPIPLGSAKSKKR